MYRRTSGLCSEVLVVLDHFTASIQQAASTPQSTAQGAKASQCCPHGAAPPHVGALVRLKTTAKKKNQKPEEGKRSSGREILAAWKSLVQTSFCRDGFLTRE